MFDPHLPHVLQTHQTESLNSPVIKIIIVAEIIATAVELLVLEVELELVESQGGTQLILAHYPTALAEWERGIEKTVILKKSVVILKILSDIEVELLLANAAALSCSVAAWPPL